MLKNKIKKFYIYLMVTLFPLVFWDFYFDIADAKFVVFVALTFGMLAGLIMCVCMGKDVSADMKAAYETVSSSAPAKWMLLWCGVNILSFCISKYKDTAFPGTGGRDYGLVTVICITIMFIAVSTMELNVKRITDVFVVTSVIVALLAVLNSYGVDFIGFYDGVRTDLRMLYQTTLGHVDICSTFFSMALPVAVVKSVWSDSIKQKRVYSVGSLIIYAGMFGGGCDSGYVVMAAMTILMVICIKDYMRMIHFLILWVLYLWTGFIMMCVNKSVETARTMDSISLIVSDIRVVLAGSFAAVVLIIIMYKFKSALKPVLYAVIIMAAVMFFAGFIYFTFINRKMDIGSLENIFRFSDEWGSRRGYVWRVTVEKFRNNPWYNILFGTGPDTLEPVLTPEYGDEMYRRFSAYYDNAHNEYIQYLMTNGIAGLTAYAGLIITCLRYGIKNVKSDKERMCAFMAVSCYLVQAVININQVITTPLMFLFMAVLISDKSKLQFNVSDGIIIHTKNL